MLSIYPAYFCKEDSGYSVIFPDLNYLSTCGETLEEAMEMAVDCLAGHLYLCRQLQEPVFPPSKPEALRPEEYLKNIYGTCLSRTILSPWFPWMWTHMPGIILKNPSRKL